MSGKYGRDGQEQSTAAGGVIIALISCLSAVLVIAGLFYAMGTSGRHKIALAAARCEPNLSPSGLPCTTVHMLVGQYTKITAPVLQQLNTDRAAYAAGQRRHLAAAENALTAEVTVEDEFGKSLARFPFPPAIASAAHVLIKDNHARATLTAEQARSSSLAQLRSFNRRAAAASAAFRTELRLVGKVLQLRPTPDQEP